MTQTEDSSGVVVTNIPIFDEEEIHEHCVVQILRSSITGDCSVGWWENVWHDMASDPPENTDNYLVACNQWGGNIRRTAIWLSSEEVWLEGTNDITEYVTHWRELPDPPETYMT